MTSAQKPDMSRRLPDAFDQIRELPGLALDDPRVASAARSTARLQALARDAAKDLPFEIDPTGFERLFEALAEIPEPRD